MDGMVSTQGRSESFYDGGASARLDHIGAMQETNKFNGQGGISTNNGQVDYTGRTAGPVAKPGFGG